MHEHYFIGFGAILVLGVVAQLIAWRTHLPSILLLLLAGILAGPVFGFLNPDELFGNLLFPVISASVAIILFEGGLSLKISELKAVGGTVINLNSIGIGVTWILGALLARYLVGMEWALALLLGAVLVVSGPTVIIPLLRQVRPSGNVASVVKWEGIVNDPIGAVLAVVVFEIILAGGVGSGSNTVAVLTGVGKALLSGGVTGILAAALIVLMLRYYMIPDFLQNPTALMIVIATYFTANLFQEESGLIAVTVMGIALTNQRFASIRHITEFKENLRVLIISSLFIILAARLPVEQFSFSHVSFYLFVALLILVVRPIAVFLSTIGSNLTRNEKLFLSWMAPRGIVAAAVVSVFALRLGESGMDGSQTLVPLTFMVIIGTVAVYGLSAPWVAKFLGVAKPNPQGVLFAGAHGWARQMALVLKSADIPVAMVDSNWQNVTEARNAGMRAYYASILSEDVLGALNLEGIGRLFALTPNEEVNSLATLHFVDIFGRSEVYQLPSTSAAAASRASRPRSMPMHLRGRYLFAKEATFQYLNNRFRAGSVVKKTPITEEFTYQDFKDMYGESALPLFILTDGTLSVVVADSQPSPRPGQTLISLVEPIDEEPGKKQRKSGS